MSFGDAILSKSGALNFENNAKAPRTLSLESPSPIEPKFEITPSLSNSRCYRLLSFHLSLSNELCSLSGPFSAISQIKKAPGCIKEL